MTRSDVADLIAQRDAAWNRRDVAALSALHAPDVIVESLMAGRVEGRTAIGEVYRAFFSAFPDFRLQSDEVIVDGSTAVQFAVASGTDTGGFMGVPATGKSFRLPVVFRYDFRDGHIAYERRLYDFTGLLVQVGVLKARPA